MDGWCGLLFHSCVTIHLTNEVMIRNNDRALHTVVVAPQQMMMIQPGMVMQPQMVMAPGQVMQPAPMYPQVQMAPPPMMVEGVPK